MAENQYFSKNKVFVEEMLGLEDKDVIDPDMANPCENHPSDHYSLAYKVRLVFNN